MGVRGELLETWLQALEAERALSGSKEAAAAELGTWLALLEPAAEGDEPAQHELFKLVAFHARSLGFEGQPASLVVLRVELLQEALRTAGGTEPAPALRAVVRSMLRIAADAHALGAAERLTAKHHREIRDFSPLVRLDEQTVLAFMLGPMTPELIDAITGRLLRECAMIGAKTAVLDVFGAAADDDRFQRTIAELLRQPPAKNLTLVLAGLRDVEGTRAALSGLGVDPARVRFTATLSEYLHGR